MPNVKWLRCQVRKGMFSAERAITIALPQGQTLEAFVPSSDVEADPGGATGRVRVQLISVADGSWVLLPAANPTPISVREVDFVG